MGEEGEDDYNQDLAKFGKGSSNESIIHLVYFSFLTGP